MSARQKRPGTTSPQERIEKILDKHFSAGKDPDRRPNTKPKSGSKADRKRTKDPRHKVRLNRKQGAKKKIGEGRNMSHDIINAAKYIIENHGKDINDIVNKYHDINLLKFVASKCMATCLGGWKDSKSGLVSENTDMVLSKDSWVISEDGSAQLNNGFKFDYDWLYNLANASDSVITEGIDETEMDKDIFSDTLTNAAAILRKLSDKEVKKYILNAAKEDEDIDIINLRDVIEDSGVNWKFIGAEVDNDKVNLFIRVKYTKDGTQEGVVEKKLSIEVKPSADVKYVDRGSGDSNDIDLNFRPESDDIDLDVEKADIDIEPENDIDIDDLPKEEEEEEPIAGLDLEL